MAKHVPDIEILGPTEPLPLNVFPETSAPFFGALRARVDGTWPLGAGAFRVAIVERVGHK